MQKEILYRLPWPPTINHYYCRRGARSYLSTVGKSYRAEVRAAVLSTPGRYANDPPIRTSGISVFIDAFPPQKSRRRDLDNILKSLLDAMTAARVWADDSQIDCLSIYRRPPRGSGEVRVLVQFDVNLPA